MSQKITRLDSRRPARIIGMNHRSVTGKVAIGGISIPFESSLERDFLIMLDFDPMVVDVLSNLFGLRMKVMKAVSGSTLQII